MKLFLNHIIDSIDSNDLSKLKNTCYVFPTQRACRHFEVLLKNQFNNQVFWSPSIMSIQEFIENLNPELSIASEIQLLTELFTVYKKEEPNILFQDFYGWGKVLLNDFDEIDRYLVNAELLYKNLQDIKDIDQAFGPDQESIKAILEFQKVIDVSGKGKLFAEFDTTWKTVGKSYFQFKNELLRKGLAYDGMLYRKTALHLKDGNPTPFTKIIFSGFNALSLAEESIFSSLLTNGTAELFFDVDRFYFNKNNYEAAKFLKRYKQLWQNEQAHWVDANGFEKSRNIDVIGTALGVSQTKIAANILTNDNNYQKGTTAVVLADELLLDPLLYALPQQEQPINITMGYSVMAHPAGEFIKLYFEYQARLIKENKDTIIPLDALQALSQNSLIQSENNLLTKWLGTTKQSHIAWLWLEKFNSLSQFALKALSPVKTPIQTFDIALGILEVIYTKELTSKEEALLTKLYQELNRLKTELLLIGSGFDINFIRKIVLESLATLKVPLGKETGSGLQVMGFLETRTLDFDNLIILSVNESFLPASSSNKSFIPFGLRKAFKMPHFTEQDSIYAYHFYRLLQRAQNVTLVYNTELTVDGSGEKSRYILQLAHRINDEQLPIHLRESTISVPLSFNILHAREIKIDKTGDIIKLIEMLLFDGSKERPISPTLVLDYIACPLKFYFNRIKKIRKGEDITNEIDAREFGNIVHHTLQNLYEPFLNKKLSKADILSLKKNNLSNQIDNVFASLLNLTSFSGKNEYQRYIIENTLKRLLDKDADQAPITIKGLELELNPNSFNYTLNINSKSIEIGGTIDRLDEISLEENIMLTRIIDYKTGKVDMQKTSSNRKPVDINTYVDNYFTKPDFKVEFQSYYYALIYQRAHPNQNVTAGIYGLKTVGIGVQYVRERLQPIPADVFDLFEHRLSTLFEEILNASIPFCQTKETNTCAYCDYKAICGR